MMASARAPSRFSMASTTMRWCSWPINKMVCASGSADCAITKAEGEANGIAEARSICRITGALPHNSVSSAWKRAFSVT